MALPESSEYASKKWKTWVPRQGPGAESLEFPLPSHHDEEQNSSISGNGCEPGSCHLSFFLPRGARAMWGFLDSGTSWCPLRQSLKFPQ